jgi:leishmanolysin
LVEFAKEYYGCDTIGGIPIAEEGEDLEYLNTHFHKFYANNELMGPSSTAETVFSKLTMKFMEATGYYKVNYDMAEDYTFGKDMGC